MVTTRAQVKTDKMLENNHREETCDICYENFIKHSFNEILSYAKKNKLRVDEDDDIRGFAEAPLTELLFSGKLWEKRFKCTTCKNINICRDCINMFPPLPIRWDCGDSFDYSFIDNHWSYYTEDWEPMGEQGSQHPIKCPFCRQYDYKLYYTCKHINDIVKYLEDNGKGNYNWTFTVTPPPYELLSEIRNHRPITV